MVTDEARRVAEAVGGPDKRRLNQLCNEIDRWGDQLVDLQRRGMVGEVFLLRIALHRRCVLAVSHLSRAHSHICTTTRLSSSNIDTM